MAVGVRGELVGRERELARLHAFVAEGRGALLLEGEAGIGKTSLWADAVAAARGAGAEVLASRPAVAEAQLPFAALADLAEPSLARVGDELPRPQRHALEVALLLAEPDGEPPDARALGTAVRGLLRALGARAPVLLAIDDVQWVDPASAAALAFALRRLDGEPVAVLLARRSEGRIDAAPLGLPLDERLEVGPLTLGALHRLLAERLGAAFPRPTLLRVHEASGGNPFYALEIARSLSARATAVRPGAALPIPDNLGELARARLADLPHEVQETLEVAAALADADVETIEAAAGGDALRRLRQAVAAGVLELEGDRVRFAHPLLAGAALQNVGPTRLRALHRRLAGVVRDPERRARHLALGAEEPATEIAGALDEAAALAARRGASGAAAELAELAAELTPAGDRDARRARLLAAAERHYTAGESARARELLEGLLDELPPGPERAAARVRLAYLVNDYELADALCRDAIADAAGAPAAQAEAYRVHGEVLLIRGDVQAAIGAAGAAAALADEAGDEVLLARALGDLALLETFAGAPTPGLLERAVEIERRRGDVPLTYGPRMILALRHLYADRLEEARGLFRELLADAAAGGDEAARVTSLVSLANLEWRAGRIDESERYADEGTQIAEQTGLEQWQSGLLAAQVRILAFRGRADEAREAARRGIELSESVGDGIFTLQHRHALGLLALSLDDPAAAAEELRDLPALVAARGYANPGVHPVAPDAVEALARAGELEEAERLLGELEAAALAQEHAWGLAAAARCRGLVLAERGDLAAAKGALVAALAGLDGADRPFERARTLLVLGGVLRRARRKADARGALGEALSTFEALGAPLWAQRARDALARIGGRAPAEGLTPTEQRVAELVAQGLSNKEAAAALFVTVRTVESNLTRIYEKLGVRSRTELAAKLR